MKSNQRWKRVGTPIGADKIVLDTGRIIPVKGVVGVSYALTGFEFGYGNVVWDYLT